MKYLRNIFNFLLLPVTRRVIKIYFFVRTLPYRSLLNENEKLKNSFSDTVRCFVGGSGNSLNNLDTSLLHNEVVIGINAGYLNRDYVNAKRKMWIIIDYFFLDPLPIEAIRAIEKNVGEALYFIPVQARRVCEKYQLFRDKQVYYLYFSTTINNRFISFDRSFADLVSPIFKPIGSAETAIICAAYMGIREIYLIGCDSDWFAKLSSERRHFFKESENEHSIDDKLPKDWVDHNVMESKLLYGYLLYKAYRLLSTLLKEEIKVMNASGGGLLDVFPLVSYNNLFIEDRFASEKLA